jgi:predicted O-methyltransferase YrrM
MQPFISPEAERYAASFSTPAGSLLDELERLTREAHPQAHMLSGHVAGRMLAMVSTLLAPRRILEIGTFTGYSALCLAEGLRPDGILHTLERREADARTAAAFFARSAYADRIRLHVGEAFRILPTLAGEWDLVFLDADKTGYVEQYEAVLPNLRAGGLLIADNVLFHGQVLETPIRNRNAAAIDAFNRHVAADARVENVMLTLRDGWLLVRKK